MGRLQRRSDGSVYFDNVSSHAIFSSLQPICTLGTEVGPGSHEVSYCKLEITYSAML